MINMFVVIFSSTDIQNQVNINFPGFEDEKFTVTKQYNGFIKDQSKVDLLEAQLYLDEKLIYDYQLLNFLYGDILEHDLVENNKEIFDTTDKQKEIFKKSIERNKNFQFFQKRFANLDFLNKVDDLFIKILFSLIKGDQYRTQLSYLIDKNPQTKDNILYQKISFFQNENDNLTYIFQFLKEKKGQKHSDKQIIIETINQNLTKFYTVFNAKNTQEFIINMFSTKEQAENFINRKNQINTDQSTSVQVNYNNVSFKISNFFINTKIGVAHLVFYNENFLNFLLIAKNVGIFTLGLSCLLSGIYIFKKNSKIQKSEKKKIMQEAIDEIMAV